MNTDQYRELWKSVEGNLSRARNKIQRYHNRKSLHLTEEEKKTLCKLQGQLWGVQSELSTLLSPRAGKQLLNEAER